MKCNTFKSLIIDLIDGSLSPDLRIQAENHLNECPECKIEYDIQLEIISSLSSISLPDVPVGFVEATLPKMMDSKKIYVDVYEKNNSTVFITLSSSLAILVTVVFVFIKPDFNLSGLKLPDYTTFLDSLPTLENIFSLSPLFWICLSLILASTSYFLIKDNVLHDL